MKHSHGAALPCAFSLIDTIHIPPIDNQGGIGSCASQAANHIQFTNAYSRYLHHHGIEPTRCPKERPEDRFTPRFTYNFSGPGTAWVYETLRDHGTLTVAEWVFDKDEKGGSRRILDGKVIEATAGWPVAPGQMKRALMNRVKNWEQIWMSAEPYREKLTTSKEGLALLEKIKRAVVNGNAVVTGGYPGRWLYAKIKNTGSYGKVGDSAVVAAAGNGGGGHQVTIIGYDDDITAEFGGVTLRGAFHIANSYGTGWQNAGYCWMFYDTVNTVSEQEALNDPALYSGPMFLTPGKDNCMFSPYLAGNADQSFRAEKVSDTEIAGNSYPVFRLFSKEQNAYLGYSADPQDRSIRLLADAGADTEWVFMPYEKLSTLDGFDKKEYKKEYEGSYWVWAVNRGEEAVGGYRFLDAGVGYASAGRKVNFATLNSGRYPVAKSWSVDGEISDSFVTKLGIVAGKDEKSSRIWTLDQFCFTDWETDVVRGMPTLYFETELETVSRNGFTVTLTRTDKDGHTERYMPALFRYAKCHPRYEKEGETISFSGKINAPAEKGCFALSFAELLKLPEGTDFGDFTWGFELAADKGNPVTVYGATLYFGGSETPLAVIRSKKTVKRQASFKF